MGPPWSCERPVQDDLNYRRVYDDPFDGIYRTTGKIFGAFLPNIKDEDVKRLQSIIESGGSTAGWFQDVISIFTQNGFSSFLLVASLALIGCSLLFSTYLIFRVGCKKIFGSQPSKGRETRCQLFLRLGVVLFLFGGILFCEIMYGVALAQMDREQRGIDRSMRRITDKIDKYEAEMSPNCPFEKSSMSKENIIGYFEGLDREILDKCAPNSKITTPWQGDGKEDKEMLLPPGMQAMIEKVLENTGRVLALIKSSSDRYSSAETVQRVKWLEQVMSNVNELKKSIHSSQSIPELQKSSLWRIRKQRERILLDAQAKTLSATLSFYNLVEKKIERAGIIESQLLPWLKGLANSLRAGYLEQIHKPTYNMDYIYYQGTVGFVAAAGLFFLAVAFFATLYKIVFLEGNFDLRKEERRVGTLFYVGVFFFATSSVFLCWNLYQISRPAMILRSSCDALFMDKDFSPNGTSFYGRVAGSYNWTESLMEKELSFPATFRETMERLTPRESRLYNWEYSSQNNGIIESLKRWKDDFPVILEDLQAAEMYPFRISIVKRIRSAMYGLMNLEESQKGLQSSENELMSELLSDLAYFDFPLRGGDIFQPSSGGGDWYYNPTTTTQNYYGWDYNRNHNKNSECTTAVSNYQEKVNKMENLLEQKIYNVTRRYNELFRDSDLKQLLSEMEQQLCETLANPTSSLLLFYLVNMFWWLVTMAVLSKSASGWDMGQEKRATLAASMETISRPLIDSEKLEEAIQNNPMAEI